MRAPFLLRLLWQPDVELDLVDKRGRPDHNKRIGLLTFLVFAALVAIGRPPSPTLTVVMATGVYGLLGLRLLIASGVLRVTGAETWTGGITAAFQRARTTTETITRQITEPDCRVDDERGDHVEREPV